MKRVFILTEDKAWKRAFQILCERIQFRGEIRFTYINSRSDAIQELAQENYDLIVLASMLPVNDQQIVLKYLNSNDYVNKPIYFLSNNFFEFEKLLSIAKFKNISLYTLPAELNIIIQNINNALFPIDTTGVIDQNYNINLNFLKVFIDASKYILESFCMLKEIHHKKPELYNKDNPKTYNIIGRLNLVSENFEGQFNIGFTESVYLEIIKRVLAEDFKKIDKENQDFAGEIVNMIYGQAKIVLNQSGHNFEKIIPEFIVTPSPFSSNIHSILIPIITDIGELDIIIEVQKIKGFLL